MASFKIPEPPYTIDEIMHDLELQFRENDLGSGNGSEPSPLITSGDSAQDEHAYFHKALDACHTKPSFRIQSHRLILGLLINPIKRLLHRLTAPYVDLAIENQSKFNQAILDLHAINRVAIFDEIDARVGARFEELNHKIDCIFEAQRQVNAELDDYFQKLREEGWNPDSSKQQEQFNAMQKVLNEEQNRINEEAAKGGRLIWEAFEQQWQLNEKQRESNQGQEHFNAVQKSLNKEQERINQVTAKSNDEIWKTFEEKWKRDENQRRTNEDFQAALDANSQTIHELLSRYDLAEFFTEVSENDRIELMNRFRGHDAEIAHRQHNYLDYFRDRPGHILDVGCGRGEFLESLRNEGIGSWGCELDPAMVELSEKRGVAVKRLDVLAALESVEPNSLGGVFSAQVAEHLFPGELLRFIKLAFNRIAPGGIFILETLNPQSLGVMRKSYYKDLDHKQPIDPEYLTALVELAGFDKVQLHYAMPFTASERLPRLPPVGRSGLDPETHRSLTKIVDKLNATIWGEQDYYIVAEILPDAASVTTRDDDAT